MQNNLKVDGQKKKECPKIQAGDVVSVYLTVHKAHFYLNGASQYLYRLQIDCLRSSAVLEISDLPVKKSGNDPVVEDFLAVKLYPTVSLGKGTCIALTHKYRVGDNTLLLQHNQL
jgi:hypothetical protein